MAERADHRLNASQLLVNLKACGELMQRLGGQTAVDGIAAAITDGLVERFGCAFARVWIVTPERTALRLVASSGLYTRLNGSFATVPMGAFKVGKIAQHCIPVLSNSLPEEPWVKDRDWAIANQIQGFAGLPLLHQGLAIGVLAVFSKTPLSDEFLEILQLLSIATAGAIATALAHQQALGRSPAPPPSVLSEQLGQLLGPQRLSLIGTERPLPAAVQQLLLGAAQLLQGLPGQYGRLIYEAEAVSLECTVALAQEAEALWSGPEFGAIAEQVKQLGGRYGTQVEGATTSPARGGIAKLLIQLPKQHVDPQTAEQAETSPGLSRREQEVLALLAAGCRDREVAQQLYISERTVKFHVKNILAKLAVRTRVQAVYRAMQQGWMD